MQQGGSAAGPQGLEAAIREAVAAEVRKALSGLTSGGAGDEGGASASAGAGDEDGASASGGGGATQGERAIQALMQRSRAASQGGQGGQGRSGGRPPAKGASLSGASAGQAVSARAASGARRMAGRLLGGGKGTGAAQAQAGSSGAGGGGDANPSPSAAAGAEGLALLAEAQEAFSQELRQNLQKLRQVIGESQKIAQKMQAVLGPEEGGKA